MLHQTMNIAAVNAILNDPAVLPGITDQQGFDVTDLLVSANGIALLADDGDACYVLIKAGDRSWEIHTNLLPAARGMKGAAYSAKAIEWAFANTDAETLLTIAGSLSVSKYAQHFGFKIVGSAPQRTFPKSCTLLRLSIRDWIDQGRASGVFIEQGHKFHDAIDALRRDAEISSHPEDVLHDCYAGFVVAMLRHCSLDGSLKAEHIYNEWARQAGYGPITVLQVLRTEVMVDIGDMVIVVTTDGFSRVK